LRDDIDRQKRFAGNAAHQLRTPLAGLVTYCHLALKLAKEEGEIDVIRQIEVGVQRMSQLVSQLLSLARSEPAVLMTKPRNVFDLNTIASTVTAELVPTGIAGGVELEFIASTEVMTLLGDQASLIELVRNLVENAIKYTPAGGQVTVKVSRRAFAIILIVEDTGRGIAKEERQKIFERFYRVPGTQEPGSGLGLSIVKEIAEAHRAQVTVTESTSSTGTRIMVQFPANQHLDFSYDHVEDQPEIISKTNPT